MRWNPRVLFTCCVRAPEAKMLDHHIEGYLNQGTTINDGDVVFDVGANIGVFGNGGIQHNRKTVVYCFEPVPDIAAILQKKMRIHLMEIDCALFHMEFQMKK